MHLFKILLTIEMNQIFFSKKLQERNVQNKNHWAALYIEITKLAQEKLRTLIDMKHDLIKKVHMRNYIETKTKNWKYKFLQ